MKISDMMAVNVAQLQQTIGISMLKSAQATAAAGATVMLQDFQRNQAQLQAQQVAQAPHPYAGTMLDLKG